MEEYWYDVPAGFEGILGWLIRLIEVLTKRRRITFLFNFYRNQNSLSLQIGGGAECSSGGRLILETGQATSSFPSVSLRVR